jgi:hypothetical protein
MRAIQTFLPNPCHSEIHRIFVNAEPAEAWQQARHFDMSEVSWVKLLFDIRTLPERLFTKEKVAESKSLSIDEITKSETGFILLDEIPGKEVVVGSVGKYWHLKIPFYKITPENFKSFDDPGYGKIAWAVSVEPFRNGSTISFELRIAATDETSWKKFHRYYSVIGKASHLIRSSLMSHLEISLGKMKFEDDDVISVPGDELIPEAKYKITSHRIIEAPPEIVWRFLMQLGCDRAGWYSIDLLDNGGKPSKDYPVKGWEVRKVGDHLAATPALDSFFEVYRIDPERCFVIGGESERMGGPFKMNWTFALETVGTDTTILTSRARMVASPKWAEWIMGHIIYPPVHGMMSGVQMNHLKEIAERDAQARKTETLSGKKFRLASEPTTINS